MSPDYIKSNQTIYDLSKMTTKNQYYLGHGYYFKDSHGQYVKIYAVYFAVFTPDEGKFKVYYYVNENDDFETEKISLHGTTETYMLKPMKG